MGHDRKRAKSAAVVGKRVAGRDGGDGPRGNAKRKDGRLAQAPSVHRSGSPKGGAPGGPGGASKARRSTPEGEARAPGRGGATGSDRPRATPPSQSHGTRVRYDIVCARCGKPDRLPFVPKTTGEVLCQACAAEIFGPDWAHGRKVAVGQKEWAFTCAKCGRQETVPFEPKPDRELFCRACLRGEEQPDTGRLRRMKRVE